MRLRRRCCFGGVRLALGRTAHRHPERAQQGQPLEIAARRRRNRNRQPLHLLDFVEIQFGKNRMFLQPERVVAAPVESLVADPAEVAHARQRDINQPIEKLPHLFAPQRDHHADRHPLAQLEIRDRLARARQHRLLPGNHLELFERRVENFHIVARFLQRHVNRDLLQPRHPHLVVDLKFLHQRRRDLGLESHAEARRQLGLGRQRRRRRSFRFLGRLLLLCLPQFAFALGLGRRVGLEALLGLGRLFGFIRLVFFIGH